MKYYTDKGDINPELLTRDAEHVVQNFTAERKPALNQTQLRRFYGEVKTLERHYNTISWEDGGDINALKDKNFRRILPRVKLLKAKSNYAWQRGVVPESFKTWIYENVDMISERKDFETFVLYFEAVVGFAYRKNG